MQIEVEVRGFDKVKEAFRRFPQAIQKNFRAAGLEASNLILDTEGLRTYPPATAANYPPTPYYIRGRGTQYKSYNKGESQRYGTRWSVTQENGYNTKMKNVATYSPYLGGEEQAGHMAAIGWRKIFEVATEKLSQIVEIYAKWVKKTIEELGL
jgi:hypothetical protein